MNKGDLGSRAKLDRKLQLYRDLHQILADHIL